jgi:hypothetical protein
MAHPNISGGTSVLPYPLIIWLFLAFCEAIRHLYIIKEKGQNPNKARSLAVRCLIATGLGLWEVLMLEKDWLLIVLTYLSTGWWIHNTVIALGLGRKAWYLNGTGPMDRYLRPYAPYFWIMLTILCFGSLAAYFFNI